MSFQSPSAALPTSDESGSDAEVYVVCRLAAPAVLLCRTDFVPSGATSSTMRSPTRWCPMPTDADTDVSVPACLMLTTSSVDCVLA